jgi:dTDP-4-dehydrorhamnose 3,5-epimerase
VRFTETVLTGAFLIDVEPHEDERGWFARAYCAREFAGHGLEALDAQANLSYNLRAGTVRGMHYQLPPAGEAKLVRCVHGKIFDVIVDLREGSPTYLHWFGVELSADNARALFVPQMFAHGFQALADDSLVFYQVSEHYTPGQERGLRYDDPGLGIEWPRDATVISDKDAAWPLLEGDTRRDLRA